LKFKDACEAPMDPITAVVIICLWVVVVYAISGRYWR
jgi:hypothetical protein